jgi:hypothetical protein
MLNFKLNELIVNVTDSIVINKIKEYIANNPELQKDIERALFDHFFSTDAIWNPVDGWYKDQPDCIVLNIPLSVYPKRILAEPETMNSDPSRDETFV